MLNSSKGTVISNNQYKLVLPRKASRITIAFANILIDTHKPMACGLMFLEDITMYLDEYYCGKCTQALNHPGLTVKVLEVGKVIQCRTEWKEFRERTN